MHFKKIFKGQRNCPAGTRPCDYRQKNVGEGSADELREHGISTIGSGREGAQLESSKVFAKEFMQKHSIPTAHFKVGRSLESDQIIRSNGKGK